jgi:hypothetical protein
MRCLILKLTEECEPSMAYSAALESWEPTNRAKRDEASRIDFFTSVLLQEMTGKG